METIQCHTHEGYGIDVKQSFASHMHVSLNNDGPVTIIVDSSNYARLVAVAAYAAQE